MELNNYYQVVENALIQLGLNVEDARCSESGQWLIYRGDIEIYVDIWLPESVSMWNYTPSIDAPPVFQVIVPLGNIPAENTQMFYQELLELNFNLYYSSFMINRDENVVALKFKRIAPGLTEGDVIEAIESIGHYGETLAVPLLKKYGIDLFENL